MSAGRVSPLPLGYRTQYSVLLCWQGASHEKCLTGFAIGKVRLADLIENHK